MPIPAMVVGFLASSGGHTEGQESNMNGRERHPVTPCGSRHVTPLRLGWQSAPSEAEWEWADRGGLEGLSTAGATLSRRGAGMMANTWARPLSRGKTSKTDGFLATKPVKRFPQNGYGLFEMDRNVWEWTQIFRPRTKGSPTVLSPARPHVETHEQEL